MIKCYRMMRGYTQIQIANMIGADVRTIQRIENGESTPSIKNFKKLIEVLKIRDRDILNYIKRVR